MFVLKNILCKEMFFMRKSKILSFAMATTMVIPQVALLKPVSAATVLAKATAPVASDITITNWEGTTLDAIAVKDATYAVKLYTKSGETYTAAGTFTPTTANSFKGTITSSKLLDAGGTIYVTYKSATTLESDKTAVTYDAAPQTTKLTSDKVTTFNGYGTSADTVKITGLAKDDKVVVEYTDSTNKAAYAPSATGYAVTAADITAGFVTIKPKLGKDKGTLKVKVTKPKYTKSEPLEVSYLGEAILGLKDNDHEDGGTLGNLADESKIKESVTTTTYFGTKDEIVIKDSNLVVGDKINVYAYKTAADAAAALKADSKAKKDAIANVTVAANADKTLKLIKMSVTDLQGSCVDHNTVQTATYDFYMTVTRKNYLESGRVAVNFDVDPTTVQPSADKIIVINNARTGTADTIKDFVFVYGLWGNRELKLTQEESGSVKLKEKDVIKVYTTEAATTTIATGTVGAGQSQVGIIIPAGTLSKTGGYIWITATRPGQKESGKCQIEYLGENGEYPEI